ncbi:MAG TPA: hypothetical protein VFA71_11185 [Terriglobales bacterium]|nr:hypothetical protein [Terriglobales bacterium]
MRTLATMFGIFLMCNIALAREKLREFSWSALQAAGQNANGKIVPAGPLNPEESLAIENSTSSRQTIQLLTIDQPGIKLPVYALRGRIKYEAVEGTGYLEMWNYFPGGGAYFSRTLAETGPMKTLSGSSGWRDVVVPFFATEATTHPSKLVANLVLPGKGKVWLSSLKLFQYDSNEDPLTASSAWWTDRQGGLAGGIGGSTLGLLGAAIGILSAKGRGRSFVIGLMISLIAIGLAALAAGTYALARGQPFGVFYPLMLGGGLAAIICGSLIPATRKRYAEIELRRIVAANIR